MKVQDNPMHRASQEPLPLRQARRCGARTRKGTPCQSPGERKAPLPNARRRKR
jgi:hypothetical protein